MVVDGAVGAAVAVEVTGDRRVLRSAPAGIRRGGEAVLRFERVPEAVVRPVDRQVDAAVAVDVRGSRGTLAADADAYGLVVVEPVRHGAAAEGEQVVGAGRQMPGQGKAGVPELRAELRCDVGARDID